MILDLQKSCKTSTEFLITFHPVSTDINTQCCDWNQGIHIDALLLTDFSSFLSKALSDPLHFIITAS